MSLRCGTHAGGSSCRCIYIWSGTLYRHLCRVISLDTRCHSCLYHRINPVIFLSPSYMGPRQGSSPTPSIFDVPIFSLPKPLIPAPPPLPNIIFPLLFCAGMSTQASVVVIHSPLSTSLCRYLNSTRATVSTYSSDAVLQEWRKTWNRLCILSTMSAPKRRCPAKALSY